MKILKKILYLEPLIIILRYIKTLTAKEIIFTGGIPLSLCVIMLIRAKPGLPLFEFDIISISSILIGFSSSILIMLFTIGGKTTSLLKEAKSTKKDLSLFDALVYRFAYITINLILLIIVDVFAKSFSFSACIYYVIYTVFILLNSLLTLMNNITNAIFCLIGKKDENTQDTKEQTK